LEDEMLEHLAEEEREYSVKCQQQGWENTKKMEEKIQAKSQQGDPRGFAMIIQAMGIDIAGSGIDEGWATGGRMAGEENEERIANFSGVPCPLKTCCCLMPAWVAQYEHTKSILVSIATQTDESHALPPSPSCGPMLCCTIS
jgi:hypothetical protein